MAVGRPIKLTPNVARKTVSITATASQTTFTPTGGYRIGDLAVYRNGVRLVNGRDFTAVDGANVILQQGASVGDVVEFGIFDSFNIADAVGKNGNQTMGGDLTVGITTLYSGTTGIVSTQELRATTLYGDGSNLTGVAGAGVTAYIDSVNLTASGIVSFTNTTDSTSSTSGAVIISGGVGIAKSLFVGNNITIGGTVTYEDVTNVDSVGIITAQTGVIITAGRGLQVTAGGLNVAAGVGTFKGVLNADAEVTAAGGVDVTGGVKVGAALTVVGALDVDGATTLDAVTIAEEVTASGGIDVTGGVKVGAALTVVGALDVDGATTLDAVTIAEEVTAAGGVDINGGLDVAGVGTFATGVKLTGGAITAGTGATIFSPASNVITAGTASTEVVRINANAGVLLNNGILAERVKIDSDSLNSDKFIRLQDGMVHYRSSAVGAANVKPDIVSTTGINTDLAIGDTIAVTIITVAGNTAHFVDSIAIDGKNTGITTYWTGGSVPSAGGGSNVDIYAFNILKTASETYTVVANQTLCSA